MSAQDDKMAASEASQLPSPRLDELMLDAASRGSLAGVSRWLRLGADPWARPGGESMASKAAQAVVDRPGRSRLACLDCALDAMGAKGPASRARACAEAAWTLARQGRERSARRVAAGGWSAMAPSDAGEMFALCVEPAWRRIENHEILDELALSFAEILGPGWRDSSGWSCLHWAGAGGRRDFACDLAERGWSADAPSSLGEPAWVAAANAWQFSTAKALLRWADPRGRDGLARWLSCPWAASRAGREVVEAAAARSASLDERELEMAAQGPKRSAGPKSL